MGWGNSLSTWRLSPLNHRGHGRLPKSTAKPGQVAGIAKSAKIEKHKTLKHGVSRGSGGKKGWISKFPPLTPFPPCFKGVLSDCLNLRLICHTPEILSVRS